MPEAREMRRTLYHESFHILLNEYWDEGNESLIVLEG